MANAEPVFRTGIGTDRHRLAAGRDLMLGGVRIPSDVGAVGHSDADALLHAITDACLGAAGLGDIGEHFPDTDPAYAGADSAVLLAEALSLVRREGWRLGNLDCTVHLERPKLAAHKRAIRERIADICGIPVGCVNVKAKTGETLGPVGRREAVDTVAVALLLQVSPPSGARDTSEDV